MLPGKAPLRGGYTDQLRTTAAALEAPSPRREERLRSRRWHEGGFWGRMAGCPQGERWGNEGHIGAGGEQTAQIITLSSGMEREGGREAGRPGDGEINSEKERE